MSKGGNTVQIVQKLCEPVAKEMGLYIWDIKYIKEGSSWFLRILMDKDGGININDCEMFHQAMSKILDDEDPIKDPYWLEISSPGIERELVHDWHFEKMQGQLIQVNFFRPIEGEKVFVGELINKDDEGVHILLEEDLEMTFQMKEVAWVRQYVELD